VDPDANIIVGSTFDERLNGRMRVSVVATGIAIETKTGNQPSRQTQASDASRSKAAPAAEVSAPQVSAEEKHPVIVQAPIVSVVATPPSEARAGSPVHDMQDGIVRSGIATGTSAPSAEPMVCPPVQRGYSDYDTNAFDPELVASLGAAIRNVRTSEPVRARMDVPPQPAPYQAEPRKSSGFSVFGITIGGSSGSKRPSSAARPSAASPSAARLNASGTGSAENGRVVSSPLRDSSLSKEKSEELLKSISDDQLDIPAFLRRQVN
jgi:cell division protein FtsZ